MREDLTLAGDLDAAGARGVCLFDLRADMCRFIIAGVDRPNPRLSPALNRARGLRDVGAVRYCGAPVGSPGSSWCPACARRVFEGADRGGAAAPPTPRPRAWGFRDRGDRAEDRVLLAGREGRARSSGVDGLAPALVANDAGSLLRAAARRGARSRAAPVVVPARRIIAQHAAQEARQEAAQETRQEAAQETRRNTACETPREIVRAADRHDGAGEGPGALASPDAAIGAGPRLPPEMFIDEGSGQRCWRRKAALGVVARAAGLDLGILMSARREKDLVVVRHCALWAALLAARASTTAMGKACGGRDHTTVVYAVARARARLGLGGLAPGSPGEMRCAVAFLDWCWAGVDFERACVEVRNLAAALRDQGGGR